MHDNAKSRVRTVTVTANESGQRVDNFLHRLAAGVPRSAVYRVIRTGQVRVNGGRVKPTRKLEIGDQVRIPPMQVDERGPVRVPDRLAAELLARLVHRDEHLLVLDKPPGVAVHAGSGLAFGAIDALRQALDAPALELVHRIDRDTSGLLLIAQNNAVNRELQDLFRTHAMDKRYSALVAGCWPDRIRTVDVPLASNQAHSGERRVLVSDSGQPAVSHFRVAQRFADATLMQVDIDTGRTHQIRVHAQHSGHPLVGDRRYGDNRVNAGFRRRGLGRLFLHATALGFTWRGRAYRFECPPDAAWQAALSVLEPWSAERS